ncbi:receptor-like protein 15 isoform X3 [Populus alba x Populus x berolinensis]|nr:receptor-like protein 15 isoform X3 [Populus alba x Populus x berolinensis]
MTNIDPTFPLGLYSDIKMLTVLLLILMLSLQAWHPLGCLEEERIALFHLKHSLNYPNGTSLPSWRIADANCCEWGGIFCNSSTGRVTELYLVGVRDQEQLGDWYFNASLFLPFQQLNALYLDNNRIAGWVEKKGGYELQKLSNLERLDLEHNSFDNTILSFVEGLPSLKLLYLGYNKLEGLIDLKDFQNLSSLEELLLNDCSLDEHSLQSLGALTSLQHLSLEQLSGTVPSLGSFPNLTTLYMGSNDFRGRILDFQNLSSLEELYLDDCSLDEHSLQSLGALTSLQDLSLEQLNGTIPSLDFQNLSSLEELYLDYCSLDEHSLQSLGALTSLQDLSLEQLNGIVPSLEFQNLSSLEWLSLDGCSLNKDSLQSLGALPSLQYLSLKQLSGTIPSLVVGFLVPNNLEFLDLSHNNLDNSIFQTIGLCDLNHLQELYMYDNDLNGFLPPCLANLTSLQGLDLSFNHLKIPMSLSPLYNLSKLKYFDGSGNEIYAEQDDHNISSKFQLESLYLRGRGQAVGAFSKFLYHQFSLQYLDLTNIQIKGEFPNWLIENNTYLQELYLENCSLSGPFLLPKNSHVNLSFLSISMNHFQGQIPSEIGAHLPRLKVLLMSENGVNGSIPSSLGNISSLRVLDISNNSLQGQIPGWIWNMSSLEFLDLSGNKFSGPLQPRFDTSSKLGYIYLSRNKLQGPITMPFYDSYKILALDLSHNNLTGRIPEWIGGLSNLRFLLLSYNNLEGEIPIQLCRLKKLTLIDLSHNYLSGNILSCMISTYPILHQLYIVNSGYESSSQQSFEFTTKNVSLSYRGIILRYFTGLDFSCNNFTGEIPPEIRNLVMIKVLNLSHNNLTGPIPPTFSNLKEIESLDLSYNKLDGEIPPQLTELFSLEFFSVAHNNLSGKTPARVAQFATFEESSYKDNPFLCGEPLPKICGEVMSHSPTPTSTNNEDNGGVIDMEVFYATFGVAYIMVLLVIAAILYINPYWRRAWFHFIEESPPSITVTRNPNWSTKILWSQTEGCNAGVATLIQLLSVYGDAEEGYNAGVASQHRGGQGSWCSGRDLLEFPLLNRLDFSPLLNRSSANRCRQSTFDRLYAREKKLYQEVREYMEMVEVDDVEDVMTTEKMAETAIKVLCAGMSAAMSSLTEFAIGCLVEIDEASERNCGTEEDDPASKKSVRFHQTPPRVFQHRMRLQMPAFSSQRSQKTIGKVTHRKCLKSEKDMPKEICVQTRWPAQTEK